MPAPSITALPPAPSRSDPSTFATRADAFVGALATFKNELDAWADYFENDYTPPGSVSASDMDDGTVGAPGLPFAADADTGIYRIGANRLGIAVGGQNALDISASGLVINVPFTLSSLSASAAGPQVVLTDSNSRTENRKLKQTFDTNVFKIQSFDNSDANPKTIYEADFGIAGYAPDEQRWFTSLGKKMTLTGTELLLGTTTVLVGQTASEKGIALRHYDGCFDVSGSTPSSFNRTSSGIAVYWRNRGSVAGNVTINTGNTTTYNTGSDRRIKEDIRPLDAAEAGARIDALIPSAFRFKEDGRPAMGFIADEYQQVFPIAVSGEPDGEEIQTLDPSTSDQIACLVAVAQDLRARVAKLEAT